PLLAGPCGCPGPQRTASGSSGCVCGGGGGGGRGDGGGARRGGGGGGGGGGDDGAALPRQHAARVAGGIRGAPQGGAALRRAALAGHQADRVAGTRALGCYPAGSSSGGSTGACSYTIGRSRVQGPRVVSGTCPLARGGRYSIFVG